MSAASLPLLNSSNVEEFLLKVVASYRGLHFDGIDASEVKVYGNRTGGPLEGPLLPSEIIGGYGKTVATALIVEVPEKKMLRHLNIDKHAWSIKPFKDTAKFLMDKQKEAKEVKDVLNVVRTVSSATSPAGKDGELSVCGMRFIVLENSSRTGKTQMAFNLQASKEFDVFYVLCTEPGDNEQGVYQAFRTRTAAFLSCIDEDMKTLKKGSVFEITTKTTLHVYAFIADAIRGADTFRSPVTRADVEHVIDDRKRERRKPFVVLLDEFPRGVSSLADKEREKYEAKGKMMRNVFRSFSIPVIISATNGTARNLISFGKRSREMSDSTQKTPWCVVIPALPPVFMTDDRVAFTSDSDSKLTSIPSGLKSKLKWILQHSRPLFAKEAWVYMIEHDNYGTTPGSWLEYLSDMTGYLAPRIRLLKEGKRPGEFKLGQVSMLIASSSTVNDNSTNLVDSHFGCLLESEPFELDLGSDGLLKSKKPWNGRCRFPLPENDILLHLTLIGDHRRNIHNSVHVGNKIGSGVNEDVAEKEATILRPFNAPLHVMLQNSFFTGQDFSGTHKPNDGEALEALVAGAVVLASHREKFCGVTFPAFLGVDLSRNTDRDDGGIDAEVYLPIKPHQKFERNPVFVGA